MDQLFLPWWTVLLLGMWAAAITLWIHPSVHREMRFWAGISTVVYLVLIFIALGGGPHVKASGVPVSSPFSLANLALAAGFAVTLIASVWTLGRVSQKSKQVCYVVLTLANAGIVFLFQQVEVGIGLLIVAGLNLWPLIQKGSFPWRVSWPERFADFVHLMRLEGRSETPGEFGLIGGVTGLMVFTLLGTISFSSRVEATRTTSSQRQSAPPSREQIETVLGKHKPAGNHVSVVDLLFGARSDLVVLMAIIVFLTLAISMIDGRDDKSDLKSDSSVPLVPPPGEIP